jgi:hypothetical protein
MSVISIEKVNFLDPWEPVQGSKSNIEVELQKELGKNHVLYGINIEAVGKRIDCDDYLFYLPDYTHKFAVVHLTWSGHRENDGRWPSTKLYIDKEEWEVQCMVRDYLEFAEEINTFKGLHANRRIGNEVALFGNYSTNIKAGIYLLNTLNEDVVLKVKGIEVLDYIDKTQNHINPWIIIESKEIKPEDFINMEFHIIS